MENPSVKIEASSLEHMPTKAHQDDAGFDCRAFLPEDEAVLLLAGQRAVVPLGFKMALPVEDGFIWEGQLRPRSGLAAKSGISINNSPGTIDSGYRGEVKAIVINHGQDPFKIVSGDRICQLVINRIPMVTLKGVDSLDDTDRGESGFGSTGVSK